MTCKNVVEFTMNVLLHAENYRSTKLFTVKPIRRIGKTLSKKFLQKFGQIVTRNVKKSKKKFKSKNRVNIKNSQKIKTVKLKRIIKQKKYSKALSFKFCQFYSKKKNKNIKKFKKEQKLLFRPPKIFNKVFLKIKKALKRSQSRIKKDTSRIISDITKFNYVQKKFSLHNKKAKRASLIKRAPPFRLRIFRNHKTIYKKQRKICNFNIVIESLEQLRIANAKAKAKEKRSNERACKKLFEINPQPILKKKRVNKKKQFLNKKGIPFLFKLYKELSDVGNKMKITKGIRKRNRLELRFLFRNLIKLKKFNQSQKGLNYFDPAYKFSIKNRFYKNLSIYLKKKKIKLKRNLCLLNKSKVSKKDSFYLLKKAKFRLTKNLRKLKKRLLNLKIFLKKQPSIDYYNLLVTKLKERNQSHRLFPLCLIHRQQQIELLKLKYLIRLNRLLLKKKIKRSLVIKSYRRRFKIETPFKTKKKKTNLTLIKNNPLFFYNLYKYKKYKKFNKFPITSLKNKLKYIKIVKKLKGLRKFNSAKKVKLLKLLRRKKILKNQRIKEIKKLKKILHFEGVPGVKIFSKLKKLKKIKRLKQFLKKKGSKIKLKNKNRSKFQVKKKKKSLRKGFRLSFYDLKNHKKYKRKKKIFKRQLNELVYQQYQYFRQYYFHRYKRQNKNKTLYNNNLDLFFFLQRVNKNILLN